MSDTPFQDKARILAGDMSYEDMARLIGLTANWWKKLVSAGARDNQGNFIVDPPRTIHEIHRIATLFHTTDEHVRQLIAADWYGVTASVRTSNNSLRPFRKAVQKMGTDYEYMFYGSNMAYSSTWWRKVATKGPRNKEGTSTVDAPTNDRLDGIAKLFGTTPEHVAQMVAADWYGVTIGIGVSDRVRSLIPLIDSLNDEDASIVASLLADGVSARTLTLVHLFEGLDAAFAEALINELSKTSKKKSRSRRVVAFEAS